MRFVNLTCLSRIMSNRCILYARAVVAALTDIVSNAKNWLPLLKEIYITRSPIYDVIGGTGNEICCIYQSAQETTIHATELAPVVRQILLCYRGQPSSVTRILEHVIESHMTPWRTKYSRPSIVSKTGQQSSFRVASTHLSYH